MAGLSFITSDTRRQLLLLIKHRGSVSLDDAMAATGMSRTNIREHVAQLERDGLVIRSTVRSTERRGRGRPSLRYSLSDEADRLFPSRDGELLGGLLDFLSGRGEDALIREFFEDYWAARERDISNAMASRGLAADPLNDPSNEENGETVSTRLDVLEGLLRDQGFMPEVSSGQGGVVIRECNCPFPEAVRRTRLPCKLEARFLERILGRQTTRVSYIPDGSPACTYEF